MRMLKQTVTAALAASGVFLRSGQQPPRSAVFTAEQSAAGRTAYQTNCATCHGPEMAGRNEAPQLAGNNFMNSWGSRAIRDLTGYIQTTMPPAAPGSLAEKMCVDIVSYILESNGAAAGSQPLTASAPAATARIGGATGRHGTNSV